MGVYTAIDDSSLYFHTQLYTGNGSSTHAITNNANSGNFKPDFLWIKQRSQGSRNHSLWDSSRGTSRRFVINLEQADELQNNDQKTFDTNGFTVGSGAITNENSQTHVAWQWKVNGGTETSFSESGSQIGGSRQVNTTAGVSLITYTGNGSSDSTIPHGLGVTPEYVMVKNRTDTSSWVSNGSVLGDYTRLHPNETSSAASGQDSHDYIKYPNTNATNLVTGVVHNRSNSDGDTYMAWCFAPIQGFSKLGKYTGNGSADGSFVHTGFEPAWLMIKRTDSSANWHIYDNKRDVSNVVETAIGGNNDGAEFTTSNKLDFLSNGFKLKGASQSTTNADGGSYFYMAFAASPFVSSAGVPITAR